MATVNFLYRSIKDNSYLTLRFYYSTNGKSTFIEVKTTIKVSKYYWENQHSNFKTKNRTLLLFRNKLLQKLIQIETNIIENYEHTALSNINDQWLKAILKNNDAANLHHTQRHKVTDYFNTYFSFKKNELKANTLKRYRGVKSLIEKFQKHENRTLHFSDMTHAFKQKFIDYCLQEQYAKNTIKRSLSTLKTICFFALRNEISVNPQFKLWKIRFQKNPNSEKPIYLSFDELKIIEGLDLTKKNLIDTRDWLIISCYTGQRFSDFMNFKAAMIYHENKNTFIEFTQQKTSKKMIIAIHSKVVTLLKQRCFNFPEKMSLRYYNGNLKLLCKMASLKKSTYGLKKQRDTGKYLSGFYEKWELISSHVGRRSFATNFYGKIPTSLLKSTTGHSTEKMFLSYIGKADFEHAKQIHKYF